MKKNSASYKISVASAGISVVLGFFLAWRIFATMLYINGGYPGDIIDIPMPILFLPFLFAVAICFASNTAEKIGSRKNRFVRR